MTTNHPKKQAFVVCWRTAAMPAPAFWYYARESEARDAAAEFGRFATVSVRQVLVAADVELFDFGAISHHSADLK